LQQGETKFPIGGDRLLTLGGQRRDNVIGGPGSFVMVAEDYNSFGRAMVKKLIAEIATAPAELRSASAEPQARRP
jgi:hypothetical protein